MRRKLYKRIVAVTLAAMTIAGSAVFIGRSTRTKAGDGSEIGTSYYDKAMVAEYNDGNIDWVNGERTLQAEDKANVLTSIMRNKQKLTILEIVPYELASVFDILIPDEEQKSTIEAYGDEIFNKFNLQYDPTGKYDNIRFLDSQNGNANNVTDDGQPITITASRTTGISDSQRYEKAVTTAGAFFAAYKYTNSTTAASLLKALNEEINDSSVKAVWSSENPFSITSSSGSTNGSVTGDIVISLGDISCNISVNGTIVANYDVKAIQDHVRNGIIKSLKTNVTEDSTDAEIKTIIQKAAQASYDELGLSEDNYSLGINEGWYGPYINRTKATMYADGNISVKYMFSIRTRKTGESPYVENTTEQFNVDIKLNKPAYDYKAEIQNYYLDRLLEGYENTNIYKYFSTGNVEVKTVVAGQLTYEDVYNEADPVDIIYVAGYATDLKGHIFRNAFFNQPVADASKAVQFMKYGDASMADELFRTNVYYKSGDGYKEYTFSELISQKVYYDSYSKVGDEYVCNELSWNSVKLLMEYIFGEHNINYKHVYYDDDGTEHTEIQRVSCMYQISQFAGSGSVTASNNMAKLYYLLCKTTDQAGTAALDKDIKTYYRDPDYFYKKYFSETKEDGTPYTYDNGVTTAAYNGNVNWTLRFSSEEDIRWFLFEVNNETKTSGPATRFYSDVTAEQKDDFNSRLSKDGCVWILNNPRDYYLFLTSWCNDGRYIPYNGVVGLLNRNGVDLLKPYTDKNWSDSGARLPGVERRFDGNDYTTITINNYFLGIDETDFIVKPDAMFTDADFTIGSVTENVPVQMSANENAFVIYMYETGVNYDNIVVRYKAYDEKAKMVSASLTANYKVLDGGRYTDKSMVVRNYEKADIYGHTDFNDSFTINKADQPELYEAFMNQTLNFTFTVKNEVQGKKKLYTLTDTAYLYFVYRSIKDLD